MMPLARHGIPARTVQALYGLGFYLWKTAAPFCLSPLYPLDPQMNLFGPRYVVGAAATIVITAGLVLLRRRHPWALVAWAWYVVMVAPMLGLVQAGPQIAADRYTYLSCLPWAFALSGRQG